VNYDNSLVVTITVTCYSWAPSSGDHLFTCDAIFWPPHCIGFDRVNYGNLIFKTMKNHHAR